MNLTNVPFDVPVILQSIHWGTNLQNPVGSNIARCPVGNRDLYEQMILRRVQDNKVAIESAYNGHFLTVQTGGCCFVAKEPTDGGLFTMEANLTGALYFVSYHTSKVLQRDDKNVVKCVNDNNRRWEPGGSWSLALELPELKNYRLKINTALWWVKSA